MKSKSELEALYQREPVRLVDFDNVSGVLHLNGADSNLHTTSNQRMWLAKPDDDGWLDIRVQSSSGQMMLLHHVVITQAKTHHWGKGRSEVHSTDYHPNILIEDIRGLNDDHHVQCIFFRLQGLHYFFYYRHTEPLLGFSKSSEQVAALRGMRYLGTPNDDDLFAPDHVYVVHNYPRFLSVRVDDRTYEVGPGGQGGFGALNRLNHEIFPIASIAFDEPVDIETALDRIWEWRRLFSQMAMLPIGFEGISVRGSLEKLAPFGDVYLSNTHAPPSPFEGYHDLSPAYIPLNMWADREPLAAAMKKWLEIGDERRQFRVNLDRVIERMRSRIDAKDVVELAAAIDSLKDIGEKTKIPRTLLDSMANAARDAAIAAGAQIDLDRLKGVLGSLKQPSLAMKISALKEGCAGDISPSDVALISKAATHIRNISAHGNAMGDQMLPAIAPTIEALAALCARFDLESSGFPARSGANDRTIPCIRFKNAVRELGEIERAAT